MTTATPNLFGRALRGSAITAAGYVAGQVLRLGSNLILTRLLYPEAFGVMALVTVVLIGLAMFSDVGIGPAIAQSPRGDDPSFLNTAWTLQVIRGFVLFGVTGLLAWPAATFYAAPELMWLLPVSGLSLIIAGFNPTRIETAQRHLLLGRMTAIDLATQAAGAALMVVLALMTGSVWALVAGSIASAVLKLVATSVWLPGPTNRFEWHPGDARALIGFGKWVFLSTACGFVLMQGDKAILGAYLTLEQLGVYNIGYFLASVPMLMGATVVGRVIIPLYRDHPPARSAADAARVHRMRMGFSLSIVTMLGLAALIGPPVVDVLYDPRYAAAGAVLVAVACAQLPGVVSMTYDHAALAAGDSWGFFVVMASRAGLQTLGFLIGAETAGLQGALIGQAAAGAAAWPVSVWLARKHRVWDPVHDAVIIPMACALMAFGVWFHLAALAAL